MCQGRRLGASAQQPEDGTACGPSWPLLWHQRGRRDSEKLSEGPLVSRLVSEGHNQGLDPSLSTSSLLCLSAWRLPGRFVDQNTLQTANNCANIRLNCFSKDSSNYSDLQRRREKLHLSRRAREHRG